MRSDKLTTKFQTALADAQSLAVGRDHQFIEPLHVMAALLHQEDGTVQHLLGQAGVNIDALSARLDDALESLPRVEGTGGDVHISRELERLLNLTDKLAQQRKDQYIASELWVLAALEGRGQLGDLLRAAGADKRRLNEAIDRLRGGRRYRIRAPRNNARRSSATRLT